MTASGKATVALVYLDIMIYNCSWGPVPWAYVPEIFPTRVRALGMGVCMTVHWITSFVFSFSTPYMIAGIGWGTFLVFAGLDVCSGVFCWFFVKETRGKVLESASGVHWRIAEREHDGGRVEEEGQEKNGGRVVAESGDGSESDVAVVAADIEWSRR